MRVNKTILNENIGRTGVIEIAANVSDNFRVHDVDVLVFTEQFSGRDEARFFGFGFFDGLNFFLGFLFFFVSGSGLTIGCVGGRNDVFSLKCLI